MAQKQSAMDFLLDYIKRNPKAEYSVVKDAAERKGHKVFPIMYGRAKALLGLVPVAKRGEGKAARAKAAAKSGVEIPRGRPRGRQARRPAAGSGAMGDLQDVLVGIQETMRERDRYRSALEQVRQVLAEAL